MHAACATHQSRVLHEVIPAEISALNYEGLYGEEKFGTKLCLIWSTNWEAGDNFEIMTGLYGEEGVWSWEKDFSQEGRRETNQLWSYARRSGGVSTWMGPFFSLELKHRKSVPIFEIGYTAILQRRLQLIWSQSWASGGRRLSRSHDYEETTGDQAKRAMRWTIHHALRACT